MLRRRSFFSTAAFAVALTLLSGPVCLASLIDEIVNTVSLTSYTNYLNPPVGSDVLFTRNGDNRGLGGADHDPARTDIYNSFQSFGLTPTLAPFSYNSTTYYNVVGTLVGKERPNDYYIVGAHYDSVNNPGADDDASGVAGILEAARVLSQYDFGASILFIAFDREEQGLIGSSSWIAAHSTSNILGMIELDMISFNYGGANAAWIYRAINADNRATQDLAAAVTAYSGGLTPAIVGTIAASDHYPFGVRGFPAALLIEANYSNNPNYHKATDSVDTAGYIDYLYATRMTRSAVGYLATEAEAQAESLPEPAAALSTASGLILLAVALHRRRRRTPAGPAGCAT